VKVAPVKAAPERLRPDSSQRLQDPPRETIRATSLVLKAEPDLGGGQGQGRAGEGGHPRAAAEAYGS
jgi:hypothetical protein